jgi:uncharacterized protein
VSEGAHSAWDDWCAYSDNVGFRPAASEQNAVVDLFWDAYSDHMDYSDTASADFDSHTDAKNPRMQFIIKTVEGCNLRCNYCYARDDAWRYSHTVICHDVLSALYQSVYTLLNGSGRIELIWHGGEPLLAGQAFFETTLRQQRKILGQDLKVVNKLQTNASLVTENWAAFFRDNQFQLGCSLDGIQEVHDNHRRLVTGEGSFAASIHGLCLLQDLGLSPGVITVITQASVSYAHEIYQFLVDLGIHHIHFLPCESSNGKSKLSSSAQVAPSQFAQFMKQVFDLWFQADNPEVKIPFFVDAIRRLLGGRARLCSSNQSCASFISLGITGDVSTCNRLASKKNTTFGNILRNDLTDILQSQAFRSFAANVRVRPGCEHCEWHSICQGGCLANWHREGDVLRNHFCSAYQDIYQHIAREIQSVTHTDEGSLQVQRVA